jgi:hypothetical protein
MHSHSREIRVTRNTYTFCGVTQKVHANWVYLPPLMSPHADIFKQQKLNAWETRKLRLVLS